jgi:rifampicin phosphotransferase
MTNDQKWVYSVADPLPEWMDQPRSYLGGKGASLHAMTQAGMPVPPAFTITTEACRSFFDSGERWPDALEEQVREHMTRLEELTGRTFARGPRPLLVSVRSGAAVSMPGMMDTLLNVGLHPGLAEDVGDTPDFWARCLAFVAMFARVVADTPPDRFADLREKPADRGAVEEGIRRYEEHAGRAYPREPWGVLVEAIDAVFRSWRTERAVQYRQHHEIHGLLGTAVNVQAMFPSEVSGVLFTRDPNDPDGEHMIVEGSYGLGEAVVSGDVSPDHYRIARDDPAHVHVEIGSKTSAVLALGDPGGRDPNAPCLSEAQLADLHRIGLEIEDHFGYPVDVEWGLANGQFGILQSRRIRGLDDLRDLRVARREQIDLLRSLAGDGRKVWVRHNLDETLPNPTPMTWDLTRRFMSGDGGFGRIYRELGYQPSRRVRTDGFLVLICGRIYADPELLAGLFYGDAPLTYDLDVALRRPAVLDEAPRRFDPQRVDGRFLLRLPRLVTGMIRSARRQRKLRRTAKSRFDDRDLPAFLAYVRTERLRDLRSLETPDLLGALEDRRRRVLDEFAPESLKPGFMGGAALAALEGMLASLGGASGRDLARRLVISMEDDITCRQDCLLHAVAENAASMDDFLEEFGHRGVREMELAQPRWREDPDHLHRIVETIRKSDGRTPDDVLASAQQSRQAARDELPDRLREWGGSSLREDIEDLAAEARALLPHRENGKHFLMMGYELLRNALCELGRRWEIGGDVFYLQYHELRAFGEGAPGGSERDELITLAGRRKLRRRAFAKLNPPTVIDSRKLEALEQSEDPAPARGAATLDGTTIASGVCEGVVRIVADPAGVGDLGRDYVLVCASTDPGWTPLFLNARGLVVERGGVLSHGAIVARDFGIPAVVCENATRLLPDGARVCVDGDRGRVTVLGEAGS